MFEKAFKDIVMQSPPSYLNIYKYLRLIGEIYLDCTMKKSEFNLEEMSYSSSKK